MSQHQKVTVYSLGISDEDKLRDRGQPTVTIFFIGPRGGLRTAEAMTVHEATQLRDKLDAAIVAALAEHAA